jgi:hypothetical protein
MVGWELCVEWKDQTTSCVSLKDMKEVYPVQVAEFAIANKIADEPAFAWWVRDMLKRCERIIAQVKSRYWKQIHKFGVRMPPSQ